MASRDRFSYTPVGTSKREGADAPLSPDTGSIGSAQRLINAIRSTETGGDFSAKGASGETGAFQFMPATWKQFSSEYNKGKGSIEQTPETEEAVVDFKVRQWLKEGLTPEQIAAKWNSGSEKDWEKKVGTNKQGVKYDVPAYVKKVMDAYGTDEVAGIKAARDRSKGGPTYTSVGQQAEAATRREGIIEEPTSKDLDPSHLPMSQQERDESQQRMLKFLKGSWDVDINPEMADGKLSEDIRGFAVAAINSYKLSDMQMAQSRIYHKQMNHTDSPYDVTRLNELSKQISELSKATAKDPYAAKAWGQLAPYVVNSGMQYGKGGLVGGSVGALLAITAGNMVPGMVAVPGEELITGPIGFKIGSKLVGAFQTAKDMYELESGAAFNEFHNILGMDEDKARMAAEIYGGGSSLLELAQFKMLKRLLPGSDKMITSAFNKALTRVISKSRTARTANQLAGVVIPEANVEGGQEFWQNVVQLTASYLEPELDKTDLRPEGRKEFQEILGQNIKDVWLSTATAMGMNAVPGAMMNITRSGKTPAVKELGKGRTLIAPEKSAPSYAATGRQAEAAARRGRDDTPQGNAPESGRPSVKNLLGVDDSTAEADTESSPGRSLGPDLTQTPKQSKEQLSSNSALESITSEMAADKEMQRARTDVVNNKAKMDALEQLYEESVQLEDHQTALQHAEDFKEVADDTVTKVDSWMQSKERKLNKNKATTDPLDAADAEAYSTDLTRKAGNMVNGQLNAVRMEEAQNQMDFEDALHTKPEVMKKALLDAETTSKNLNKPENSKIYRKVSDGIEQQRWMSTDEFYGKNVSTKKMLELRGDLERKLRDEKDNQKVPGTEKAVDQASMDWITDTLNGKNQYDLAVETEAAIADKQRDMQKEAGRLTSADPKVQARTPKPKTEGQKKAASIQAAAKRAGKEKRVQAEKKTATAEAVRKKKAAAISKQAAKLRKTPATQVSDNRKAEIAASKKAKADIKKQQADVASWDKGVAKMQISEPAKAKAQDQFKSASIKIDGKVWSGSNTHMQLIMDNPDLAKAIEDMPSEQFYARVEKGFQDNDGKFVDRLTASDRIGLGKDEYLTSEDFISYELAQRDVVVDPNATLKDKMGTLDVMDALEEEMVDGPYAKLFKRAKAAGAKTVFLTSDGQYKRHPTVKKEFNNMKALERASVDFEGDLRLNPKTGQMVKTGGYRGVFLPLQNTAFINLRAITDNAKSIKQAVETVVHENVHGLITANEKKLSHAEAIAFRRELGALWKTIPKDMLNKIRDSRDTHTRVSMGIIQAERNIEELVTYALSHPEFAAWLDTMPAPARARARSSKIKTLWDSLVNLITTKVLKTPSMLTEVNDILNRHMKLGEKDVKFSKEDTSFAFGQNVSVDNVQEWHDELSDQAVNASDSTVVADANEAEKVLGFRPDDNVPSVWIKSYDTKVYGKGKPKKVTVPAQVVFIADRITSRDHFVQKWMHEQVAHNGLREVFGKNTALFNRFLDQAHSLFTLTEKDHLNDIVELYDFGKVNDKGARVLSAQNKRDAAEEVIALKAEKLKPVTKRGLISRMKSFVKSWLPKSFVNVEFKRRGATIDVSDKDIMNVLESAKAHVMQGDTKYADFINKALQDRAPTVKFAGWNTLPKFMVKDSEYKKWVLEVVKQAPQLRKWYDGHMETVRNTFGDDSDIFQILLAVTSPQTDVETNVQFAIDSYAYMLGIRDKPGSLYPNRLKERIDTKWTSPENMFRDLESNYFKVTEFGRALLGDEMATVGDIWMYRAFFGDPATQNKLDEAHALTKPHVVALRQKLHDLASQLTEDTGEVYTPREVQAAIWVYVNSVQTGKDISTVADYQTGLNRPSVKYGGKSPLEWLTDNVSNLSDGLLSKSTGVKKIPLAPISPLAKQAIQQYRIEMQSKGQKTKYSVDSSGNIDIKFKSTNMDIQNVADALVADGRVIRPVSEENAAWLKETFGFEMQDDGTMLISDRAIDLFKSPKTGKVTFPAIRDNLGGFSGAYTREVMFSREVDKAHNKLKDLDAQQQAERDAQFMKTGNDGMSVIGKIHEWRDTASRNVDRFITGLEQEFLEKFGGRKTLAKVVGSGRLVSTAESNLAQRAFNLFIDSGTGSNLNKVKAYGKKILNKGKKATHAEKQQLDVIVRMLGMSAGERGWADSNIRPYYEDYFKFAKDNKIIESHVDNYVKRTWNIPKELEADAVSWNGVGTTGFTLTANSGKQRSFDSIVDGWERGMTLKADGVLTNLKNYADEIGHTYANRRFVEYMRNMITFKKGGLMHEINPKTSPDWKPPANYIQVTDRGFAKPGHKLYARKDIGVLLNKLGAKPSWQLWNVPLVKGVVHINAAIKSTILSISLFHHLAGMRSYGYGVSGKKFRINGIKAYKRGLEALGSADSKRLEGYNHLGPIVDLLIKEGLTVGKTQDWDEGAIMNSMIENYLSSKTGKLTGMALKKWQGVRLWKQGMTQGLFARVFAGLKAESASIEFVHSIQVQEAKLGRPLNDAEIKLTAQQVGVLINADFGGLHLGRMGRNPDLQKAIQMVLLAPDWTESNWRTVTGMVPGLNKTINKMIGDNPELPGMHKVYRKFWKGVMFRGAFTLMLSQAAIMGLFADDDEREEYWDFFKSNVGSWEKFAKGRWASVDYTPLARALGVGDPEKRQVFNILGHFKDMLKIADPMSLFKHKVSPLVSTGFDALSGTDWKGTRFSTVRELIESGGSVTADSRYAQNVSGMALTSTIPSMLGYRVRQSVPIFMGNALEAAQGESSWFTAAGRAAGFDTRDVSHQSQGQRKFEEVRAEVNELDRNERDATDSGDRGLISEAKKAKRDYPRFDAAKSRMNYARTQLSVVNRKIKALELKLEEGEKFSKSDEKRLTRAKKDQQRIYDRFLKVINR